ncbi:hypothetical protein [Catenulispora subtropica]|uniref:Ig-like domain-containing protein n=1 Tax=Catenulispora subtropica TaxID=450798 RepID=A0ABN2QQG7_9ACTN
MTTVMTETIYQDILIRDNFADTGQIPTTGTICASPDIIPYGRDVLGFEEMQQAMNRDLGKAFLTRGQPNNIYIRAKNIKPEPTHGTVEMYWAPPSLLLAPSQWGVIEAPSGGRLLPLVNGQRNQTIQAQEVCAASQAFEWMGSAAVDTNHYCLIAKVSTDDHHDPMPRSFATNVEFANWVANNPSVAWRNVDLVQKNTKTITRHLLIANLDPQPGTFRIEFEGRGVPNGAALRFTCSDTAAPVDWEGWLPGPDRQGWQRTRTDDFTLPGGLPDTGTTYTLTQDALPETAYVNATLYKVLDNNATDLERDLVEQMPAGFSSAPVKNLLRLGNYEVRVTS